MHRPPRPLLLLALLAAPAACSRTAPPTAAPASPTAPAAPASPPAAPAPTTPTTPTTPAAPATLLLSGELDGAHVVTALSEAPGSQPVRLSAPGTDATFVAALPDHRALLFERAAAPAPLCRLALVRVDGSARVELPLTPADRYASAGSARLAANGAVLAVELLRNDSPRRDVWALSATNSAPPRLLAEDATLVAASADRVAVLAAGDLRSLKLDGSAALALGGRDGLDEVAAIDDAGRVLLTLHGHGPSQLRPDVRVASLDGTLRVDLGRPDADERAVAFLPGARVLFTRAAAGHAATALVSGALDGTPERPLTTPEQGAIPRHVTPTGLILVETAASALASLDATAATPTLRTLDPDAGHDLVIGTVTADRVLYTGTREISPSLRAAHLDGTHVAILCERPLWLPFYCALTPDHRVVFHRALAGQVEGGQAYSVNLDGTDLREIGTNIVAFDGSQNPEPADQDFLAVTPAGHVILEAEYETSKAPQLLLAAPQTTLALELPRIPSLQFQALIP